MVFDRMQNLLNSLLTLFSCGPKGATVDDKSLGPRSAPPPSNTPVDADPNSVPPSPRSIAANDVSAREDSLTTPISPQPSPPQIGHIPVTVPETVTDKLMSIMNAASTKPTPRRIEGKVTFTAPLFCEDDFHLRVLQKKVSLEMVTIGKDAITGYIRVLNLSYEKRVAVRYTLNKWGKYRDVEAEWVETVEDGIMDRFVSSLPAPESPGELTFAVRFNDDWDNNEEKNYTVLFNRT